MTHDDGDGKPTPEERPASPLTRRAALKVLGAAPIAGALAWQQQQQGQQKPRQTHEAPNQPAQDTKQPARAPRQNKFFTAREARTVRVLADDVIPRDERSGSATEAGVLAFLDFNLSEPESSRETRTAWRGGLRWLDAESRRRFGVAYASAKAAQRHQILDDIAWPDRVRPELRHGAAFFARARDMVAAGFFSSAMGYRDLQYQGNVFVPKWSGCPEPALQKLGVSYDLMKKADTR
ncbi:MAG: gluconate 2-dehydrogenase subunit 3 family protein [Gemmatimonadaceae bacterium]